MKGKQPKLKRVSFPTTVEHNGVGPHLYIPSNGAIYLSPDFKSGDKVRVTVTKIGHLPARRKGKR